MKCENYSLIRLYVLYFTFYALNSILLYFTLIVITPVFVSFISFVPLYPRFVMKYAAPETRIEMLRVL